MEIFVLDNRILPFVLPNIRRNRGGLTVSCAKWERPVIVRNFYRGEIWRTRKNLR